MTVSSTTTRVAYTGNGATTAFPVPFVFFGEDEIEVIERTVATGSETTKTLTTHYSVSGGNGSTGTVTAVSAPASTVEWHIRRRTARTQLVDYTPNDPFPSETHERALDRLTAIGQEIGETAERALVVPVTDPTDVTLQLPNSIDRASKFLAFNSDGSPTAVAGTGTAGAASTGTAGIVELATAGETITGTDTARAVTPAGLAAAYRGKMAVFIPAGAMVPQVTNGPQRSITEHATNDVMLETLDYDQTTSELAQFAWRMPESWNESTVTFRSVWTAAAGTATQTFIAGLKASALSDDDAIDGTWGTGVTVSDALLATGDMHISAESSAVTVGGTPAAGDMVIWNVYRDISDTLAADARLAGIVLYVTTNAGVDG